MLARTCRGVTIPLWLAESSMPSTANRRCPSPSRCSAAALAPAKLSMAIEGISASSASSARATNGSWRRFVSSTKSSPVSTQSSTKPSTSAVSMFQASFCWFCAETSAMPAPRASQTRESSAISARAQGSAKK